MNRAKARSIPYGKQDIDNSDIREVLKVLRSDWITQGPKIEEFERALAGYCGTKYAVAVSSGTAALHLACLAAGLKKGDEAITSTISFVATSNSVLYAGARPVFADIDPRTTNIDCRRIKENITKKTTVLLPVHFAGLPCEMPEIAAIAATYNLTVIEDACHALGAEYRHNGRWVKVGSCRHSDMTAFSFHPVKLITTGEGGAITTNNRKYYECLKALRSHGIYKDKEILKRGQWYYEMRELGFNYRITDFQAAMGISQLRKIKRFLENRRKVAAIYNEALGNIDGINITPASDNIKHAYHIYVLKIDYKKFNTSRINFFSQLNSYGIRPQVHYIPLYRQPYYRKLYKIRGMDFKMSEAYYREAVSIPLYHSMRMSEVKYVIENIKRALSI